jgi:DNA polymerase
MESIRQRVVECTNCDLCKTRTNAVPGKGAVQADVVFVGEAPGRNEDQHGEPFVGVAGKRLTLALEKAGVSRDSVYITNAVKCRPPNNRVPKVAEREACRKYLQEEIEIIKPKVICVLGNTAFNSILGGTEITKHRGKTMRRNGQVYFLTVHPAATIYNQELIEVLDSDIKKLFEIAGKLRNGNQVNIDIEYAP